MKRQTPQVSKFKMQEVDSSNIKAIGHSKSNNVLKVEFHNGSAYTYYPVARGIYKALLKAESVGKEFNQVIRSNKKLESIQVQNKNGEQMDEMSC